MTGNKNRIICDLIKSFILNCLKNTESKNTF
jgi:hypothetical protein